MKKGDVIRQKCVNTTFYLTGILAHKVNNISLPDIYVIVHLFHATQSRYHFKLKVKPSYDLNCRVLSKILVISMKGFD